VNHPLAAIVLASGICFFSAHSDAQEHDMGHDMGPTAHAPGMPSGGAMDGMMGRGGMPMGRSGRMGSPGGMDMMMHDPKIAGLLMQMRGEMMRIRGEAMMKQADVLRRYGEQLQQQPASKAAPQTSGKQADGSDSACCR
jgi:hypothetical protein